MSSNKNNLPSHIFWALSLWQAKHTTKTSNTLQSSIHIVFKWKRFYVLCVTNVSTYPISTRILQSTIVVLDAPRIDSPLTIKMVLVLKNMLKMIISLGKKTCYSSAKLIWRKTTWSSSTCNLSHEEYAFWCLLSYWHNNSFFTQAFFPIAMITFLFTLISFWCWQKGKEKEGIKKNEAVIILKNLGFE